MKLNVQDIKATVNIVDVISNYVGLKPSGKELVGICPFHNDKTPSLYVNEDKQLFICRACSVGGDVLDFIINIDNLSFQEAVEEVAKIGGIDIKSETADQRPRQILEANAKAQELFRKNVPIDWIKERGYPESYAEKWKVGYAPKSGHFIVNRAKREGWLDIALLAGLVKKDTDGKYYDFFRDRYMFPIESSKRLVAFGGRDASGVARAKFLNSSESAVYSKSRTLYGLDAARKMGGRHKELIVSEGYMDLWAFYRANMGYAVASTGTSLTKAHATVLSRVVDGVVLCYDGDEAGAKATMRALGVCFSAGLPARIARPPNGMDPDDMESADLKKLIKNAPDSIVYYHEAFGDIQVHHKKRLLEKLGEFIAECPSKTLRAISYDQINKLFKVDVSKTDKPKETAVGSILQRAVYAVMQDYVNAETVFDGIEREMIEDDTALAYLYDAWREGLEPGSWVSRAPDSIRKRLISAVNQLKFSKQSLKRIRLLILDESLNRKMSIIEERIGIAESINNPSDDLVEQWDQLNEERIKLNATLRISL